MAKGQLVKMSGPIFVPLEGTSPTITGVSHVISYGLGSFVSAGSKAADLYPHDAEGLLQILRFRNQVAKIALKRSRWIGGRLFNRFSGEDTDYIPISGTHLRQTLRAVGIRPPKFIVNTGKYKLRLDVSKEAVLRLVDMPMQSLP